MTGHHQVMPQLQPMQASQEVHVHGMHQLANIVDALEFAV